MKKGHKIRKGDTVGIVALASSCEPQRFAKGLQKIESLGFKTKVVLDPTANYGKETFLFSSDSAQARAKALEELFLDPSVKFIMAARGAYGSTEILPHLNFDLLRANPKTIVGFSDISAILNAVVKVAGIVSVHGPMASGAFAEDFSDPDIDRSISNLFRLLSGEINNPFHGMTFEQLNVHKGDVGTIVGGSFSTLMGLVGTPWEPDFTGKILFLEEVSDKPFRIHRMLNQLKLGGKLEKLAGVLVGSFFKCEHPTGPTVKKVIQNIFSDARYPVLMGIPAGHDKLNLAVPFGVKAVIEGPSLKILESTVELS